ncbi:MAG: hypothetical protein HUJ63_08335, partial [Enterococcus sp.]|nr:hypothetical protein [Enterococcus sp.]
MVDFILPPSNHEEDVGNKTFSYNQDKAKSLNVKNENSFLTPKTENSSTISKTNQKENDAPSKFLMYDDCYNNLKDKNLKIKNGHIDE